MKKKGYITGKGTIQIKFDQKVPTTAIKQILKAKAKMNEAKRAPETVVKFASDGNLAIHVTDLKKAEVFYSNVLQFGLSQKTNKRLVYETGRATLYVMKDKEVLPFIPALEVADFKQAKQYLIKNGCRIIKEWSEDKALYFEDPFGIVIDIVEKQP